MKEEAKNIPIWLVVLYFLVIIGTTVILFSQGAFEGNGRALTYFLAVLSIVYSATPAVLNLKQKSANLFAFGGMVLVVVTLVVSST